MNDDLYDILETLCEIQKLLYTSEENRTVEKILRLHNQTFLHMLLLKRFVKKKTLSPKMSSKKFYGKYLHAIIAHGPLMVRIISGISANTEQKERTFNTLKPTTSLTSNFHPYQVVLNCIIQLKVKQEFNSKYCHQNDSIIKRLAKDLPKKIRSTIPYWIIEN